VSTLPASGAGIARYDSRRSALWRQIDRSRAVKRKVTTTEFLVMLREWMSRSAEAVAHGEVVCEYVPDQSGEPDGYEHGR